MLIIPTFLWAQEVMNPELLWDLKRVGSPSISPDGEHMVFTLRDYEVKENSGTTNLYIMSTDGKDLRMLVEMDGSQHSPQWKSASTIGFLSGGDWFEASIDGTYFVKVLDLESAVSNVSYSPDGSKLMFSTEVKTRENLMDLYPDLEHADVIISDELMYRHWDQWSDDMRSHVFYVAYADGEVSGDPVDIMEGEDFDTPMMPFGGADDMCWTPNSDGIVYVCKKVTGLAYAQSTNSDLYLYDLSSKSTINLTEGMMGYDNSPSFSPDGRSLAWLSMERDGYESDKNRLFVMNWTDRSREDVSTDFLETISSYSWSGDSKKIFFQAPKQATYQIYEMQMSKGSVRQISDGDFNYGHPYPSGKHIFCSRTDMNHAAEIYRLDIKKGESIQLTHANDVIYDGLELCSIEKRWIETTDGKEMLTWVIYPPNFDPAQKYPTLLYCQGGPQSAVSQFYSFRWNFQLMASAGYIVVAPNRRGLPGFGLEWNEAISQDWGGQAMKDYLSAIDALAEEPYVDEDKVGAIGASYGGYSVYMLAGIHDGRFKSLISHCGLFNLESWYGTTEELFFANFDVGGPYWGKDVPESYAKFSPHNYVDNWDTPILVFHGGRDYRVPDTQGLEAFQAAQIKGIPSRLVYFPDEGHWILSPQNGMVWHAEFFGWLDKWLK
jgi:dipeptidyl aminopeptidase/acylaminoacyl peptidase